MGMLSPTILNLDIDLLYKLPKSEFGCDINHIYMGVLFLYR